MLTSSRTTNILLLLELAVGVAIVAMLATGVRGGPLDPPGSPASTDSVRLPGTPVNNVPFTISQPGHYYLTRNLTALGAQIAITINASDVSLDLGGFTVSGNDSSPSWGIYLGGQQTNVHIENGTVRDFQFGLDAGDDTASIDGVRAESNVRGIQIGSYSLLANCEAALNDETGIYVSAAFRATVRRCTVVDNKADGITVSGDRNVIEQTISRDNDGPDIRNTGYFSVIRGNTVDNMRLEFTGTQARVIDNVCGSGLITDVTSGSSFLSNNFKC